MKPGRRRAQAGFSLIECLVAACIAGILGVSAFYFLTSQSGMGVASNDMLKGLNLGKLKMDSLKVADYDTLQAGSDTVSERYIRAWQISPQPAPGGGPSSLKKIELTVYWPLTADHSVSFASLLSDGKYKEDR
jgi:prepilin-type N-terminal cleavage/methylation domain-containing protein